MNEELLRKELLLIIADCDCSGCKYKYAERITKIIKLFKIPLERRVVERRTVTGKGLTAEHLFRGYKQRSGSDRRGQPTQLQFEVERLETEIKDHWVPELENAEKEIEKLDEWRTLAGEMIVVAEHMAKLHHQDCLYTDRGHNYPFEHCRMCRSFHRIFARFTALSSKGGE